MSKTKEVRTMLNKDNLEEAVEVLDFLKTLENNERRAFLSFLQGVKFARGLSENNLETSKAV